MKKRLFIILVISIFIITGCSIEATTSINSGSSSKLTCTGTKKEGIITITSNINLSINKNKITKGNGTIILKLDSSATEEEKNILLNFSMCSDNTFGSLIDYGNCSSDVSNSTLTTKLSIDKNKINKKKISLDKIKKELESKTDISVKCKIK